MTGVLDKEVHLPENTENCLTDIETIVWELPGLFNTRFSKFDAGYAEVSSRLHLMDLSLAALQNDVRDLRGGVTRQLNAQDQRLKEMEGRLSIIETQLKGIEIRLRDFDQRLNGIETRLDGIETRVERMETMLATILERLPAR